MAIRDTSVILYRSTDAGMPQYIDGLVGSALPIFSACLVDGSTPISVDSIVVANGFATLTRAELHGFQCPGAAFGIDVGQVIEIAGVTGALSGLNRRWRATVTSTSVLTWECGLANGTAAGTITVKKPSLGFTETYNEGYARGYRSGDSLGNQDEFIVYDDSGQYCQVFANEHGTGTRYPNGTRISNMAYYWQKSSTASSVARPWMLIGDARGFYVRFHNGATAVVGYSTNAFIELVSDNANDQYCTFLTGTVTAAAGSTGALYYMGTGHVSQTVSRAHTGLSPDITVGKYSHGTQTSGSGNTAERVLPSLVGNRFLAAPIEVWESAYVRRGLLPGCYAPLNTSLAVQDGAVFRVKDSRAGSILMFWRMTNAGSYYGHAFDLIGPWR